RWGKADPFHLEMLDEHRARNGQPLAGSGWKRVASRRGQVLSGAYRRRNYSFADSALGLYRLKRVEMSPVGREPGLAAHAIIRRPMPALTGVFRLQYSFDVCEEIDLDRLRGLLQLAKPGREPGFGHQAPVYVRFERPPVDERIPALRLASGEHFPARI